MGKKPQVESQTRQLITDTWSRRAFAERESLDAIFPPALWDKTVRQNKPRLAVYTQKTPGIKHPVRTAPSP